MALVERALKESGPSPIVGYRSLAMKKRLPAHRCAFCPASGSRCSAALDVAVALHWPTDGARGLTSRPHTLDVLWKEVDSWLDSKPVEQLVTHAQRLYSEELQKTAQAQRSSLIILLTIVPLFGSPIRIAPAVNRQTAAGICPCLPGPVGEEVQEAANNLTCCQHLEPYLVQYEEMVRKSLFEATREPINTTNGRGQRVVDGPLSPLRCLCLSRTYTAYVAHSEAPSQELGWKMITTGPAAAIATHARGAAHALGLRVPEVDLSFEQRERSRLGLDAQPGCSNESCSSGATKATPSCPCHTALYCSKECQRADWPGHKGRCDWHLAKSFNYTKNAGKTTCSNFCDSPLTDNAPACPCGKAKYCSTACLHAHEPVHREVCLLQLMPRPVACGTTIGRQAAQQPLAL